MMSKIVYNHRFGGWSEVGEAIEWTQQQYTWLGKLSRAMRERGKEDDADRLGEILMHLATEADDLERMARV